MKFLKNALIAFAIILFTTSFVSAEMMGHTSESLNKKWGQPVSIINDSMGMQKRIYGPIDVVVGYRYFLLKGDRIVDHGFTGVIPTEKQDGEKRVIVSAHSIPKNEKPVEFKVSGIMASHYSKNRTTVQDIIAEYGEPINTFTDANGLERMVFNTEKKLFLNLSDNSERTAESITGYKFFIAKDGRIVDEGFTNVLFNEVKEKEGPSISPFMANWYKKHPQSVDTVKDKLGDPVEVKKYKNGMIKLVFGDEDVVTCSTYVIAQGGNVVDKGFTSCINETNSDN